jgi:glutamyl-Q tRNA(Asp) synthetase
MSASVSMMRLAMAATDSTRRRRLPSPAGNALALRTMIRVFRFAPSPNGDLHLGHAFSALTDFALCRQAGGRFLLRMEDIDPQRCRPEYEARIREDLAWLGIAWEAPVRRQSEHMADYARAIEKLAALDLLYPSFMSRGEIAAMARPDGPRDPDGVPLYPGSEGAMNAVEAECRAAAGEPHVLRLRVAKAIALAGPLSWQETGAGPAGEHGTIAADPSLWGDFVVARREVPTSYHLAVVVDDALQGVSHVVRGRDLFHATSAHVLLQRLLGLPTPVYHHHRLITDASGRKLAKSDRDTSLRALREGGVTADEVRAMVGV